MSELVERLRGIYRVPITDGLGATGGGLEPDNPNEFVRRFEPTPIGLRAADEIERLTARVAELEGTLATADQQSKTLEALLDGHISYDGQAPEGCKMGVNAAGYRILGPGELDAVTLERAAGEIATLRDLLSSQYEAVDVSRENDAYVIAEKALRALAQAGEKG